MSNSITFEEILVSQTFEIEGNEVRQIFSFNKRNKAVKYMRDHRYLLYDKFEQKIRELSLSIEGIITFTGRKNEEDRVTLVYEIIQNERFDASSLVPINYKLADFTPPSAGCPWCKHKRPQVLGEGRDSGQTVYEDAENALFFFCEAKQKTLSHELKNCKYFKQKRLFKT